MKTIPLWRPSTATLGFLIAALLACNSDHLIGPGNQLEITNAPDDFQFQVSKLNNVTQRLMFIWNNTGDSASVNQSSAVQGGSATLTIRGPTGLIVYDEGLENYGTFQTEKSTAGLWTIEVTLSQADGTVNFRVQKAP